MFLDLDLLGFGFCDKFDRSGIPGFSGCLDVGFSLDLVQKRLFFRKLDVGFSLDIGFESLINHT